MECQVGDGVNPVADTPRATFTNKPLSSGYPRFYRTKAHPKPLQLVEIFKRRRSPACTCVRNFCECYRLFVKEPYNLNVLTDAVFCRV